MQRVKFIRRGNVELFFCQKPRFEDKVAILNIEREPGDIDVTVTYGQFETRFPLTRAVRINEHVVRLRRNFVYVDHLCAILNHTQQVTNYSSKVMY